ncbi:hypothetical protein [Streptomyces sp. NRRL F-5126]|uniref:hypothetical protein n=1 Tax=Streptomyces sp. NRRL F-5126 TaxID=1463857 RepID=UPI0004C6E73E|nr:hypothetical protein [Streptomyces sp. NRRL F-5126]
MKLERIVRRTGLVAVGLAAAIALEAGAETAAGTGGLYRTAAHVAATQSAPDAAPSDPGWD